MNSSENSTRSAPSAAAAARARSPGGRAAGCSYRHVYRPRCAITSYKLQSRRRGQRLRPRLPFLLQQLGEQEGEIDRLLRVEPRIAERVVAVVQVLVGDGARAAGALGDVLARHLEMHAPRIGAFGRVDREEGLHLLQDAIERPRLVARGR